MLGASISHLLQVPNHPVTAALSTRVLGILPALCLALRLIARGSVGAVFEAMKQ